MRHTKLSCVCSLVLLMLGSSAEPALAAPTRKAVRAKAVANDPELSVKAAVGAPFRKVVIEIIPEACGRLGCEVAFSGLTAAGKYVDITFTEILSNSTLGTKAEMFGALDSNGMPQIVLEQGLINGGGSFNLFLYKPNLRRYSYVKRVSGYAAGKVRVVSEMTPTLPAKIQVSQSAPLMPRQISYAGPSTYKGTTVIQDYELEISGGVVSGIAASQVFGRLWHVPVNGTYADGICTIRLKDDTLTGPCDTHGFAGQRLSKKGQVVGSFTLRNADELPSVASYSNPAPVATQVERQTVNSGVWSLGRARFLVEPRGGCGPETSLGTRSYCFNQAIDWLRRHPDRQSVDVVAMQNAWLPGSFVPHNSGQGWDIYKVARQGEDFRADKQRHYATKVQVPQGCMYSGVADQAWYITLGGRGKVAVEAANYVCMNPWAGRPIYTAYLNTQDVDGMPGDIQIAYTSTQQSSSYVQKAGNSQRPSNANGYETAADFGGPRFRENRLSGTSAEIYGEPDVGQTRPKPRTMRNK